MIAEILLTAVTRAPRPLRDMGLVEESIGLWSRRGRRRRDWAEHEARCHMIVRQSMKQLQQRRTALVLGSGLARDIPIAALSNAFEKVILVDAVHLPVVRLRLARHRNLTFVTRDLSGIAGWLAGEGPAVDDPLAVFATDPTLDLVVSANLLSQIPIGVQTWLEAHPEQATGLEGLPAWVVSRHLAGLSRLPGRKCLLTDTVMREEDRDGRVLSTLDLLHGHVLPPPDAEWDWPVAPFGEVEANSRLVHRVHGYGDWGVAGAT